MAEGGTGKKNKKTKQKKNKKQNKKKDTHATNHARSFYVNDHAHTSTINSISEKNAMREKKSLFTLNFHKIFLRAMDDSSAAENGSPPDPILQELLALAAATAGGPSRAAAARVEAMRRLATMAAPAVEPVPSRLRAADADAAIAMARELHTVRVYL
jgi:hypothetical protein